MKETKTRPNRTALVKNCNESKANAEPAKFKFVFHHFHGEINKKMIIRHLYDTPYQDGLHCVRLKNRHKLICNCVNVPTTDPRVFWAYRGSRSYPSPMILADDAKAIGLTMTDDITLVFRKEGDRFHIITCYAGSGSPKEPSTALPDEYDESVAFWQVHALVPDESYRMVTDADELPSWADATCNAGLPANCGSISGTKWNGQD